MSVMKNCVLLLKSQKTDEITDKYEELLAANGYSVLQLKSLIFEYRDLSVLFKKLCVPDEYSGLILSSPRCVNAVYLALEDTMLDAQWKSKDNFCVGEATFAAAQKFLDLNCKGGESGNANNLADLVIKEKKYTKPFLFPHGNLKTGTLNQRFREVGLSLDETLVYETVANPNLEKEFKIVTENFTVSPEFIVFFSPSGVQSSLAFIKRLAVDWSLLKFVAIGPVTEEKMKEDGIPVNGVAQKPNPKSVLDVICEIK